MKQLLSLIFLGICGATPAFAQYTAFKSADGVLLISNRPDQYFSFDIPGPKIIPVGENQAPHPYFIVYDRATMKPNEGRMVQVMPVPLAEFKGNLPRAMKAFCGNKRNMKFSIGIHSTLTRA